MTYQTPKTSHAVDILNDGCGIGCLHYEHPLSGKYRHGVEQIYNYLEPLTAQYLISTASWKSNNIEISSHSSKVVSIIR